MRCEAGGRGTLLLLHLRINVIIKVYKPSDFLSLDATSSEKEEMCNQRLLTIAEEGMALTVRNWGKLELLLQ